MPSDQSRRALVGLAVGVPISVLFLWLAVRNADLTAVRHTLEEAEPGDVVLAVAALMAVYLFQGARWRSIAATPQVGLGRFYEMVVSGSRATTCSRHGSGTFSVHAGWDSRRTSRPGAGSGR